MIPPEHCIQGATVAWYFAGLLIGLASGLLIGYEVGKRRMARAIVREYNRIRLGGS